jgi:hypothetical protein
VARCPPTLCGAAPPYASLWRVLTAVVAVIQVGLAREDGYLSHSPAYPSATDLELAFYPDSLYVIISLSLRGLAASSARYGGVF